MTHAPSSPTARSDSLPPASVWCCASHEFSGVPLEIITGKLPEDLVGTLYRNGGGRWQAGSTTLHHLFDGDGMISAYRFDGRSVLFRNRFVRTRSYESANRAGRLSVRQMGMNRPGGVGANMLRLPANLANTNVLYWNRELLALWEAGNPTKIEPDSLETVGNTRLGGALRMLSGAYSAHPRHDPARSSVVNFGYDVGFDPIGWLERRPTIGELLEELKSLPAMRLYETDVNGKTRRLRAVSMPKLRWLHDFALTQTHAMFVMGSVVIKGLSLLLGTRTASECMEIAPDLPTWIVAVPRDGGRIRIAEAPPSAVFHIVNAYDDGTAIVVECPQFSVPDFQQSIWPWTNSIHDTSFPAVSDQRDSGLTRYRLERDGRLEREQISTAPLEFPQFDQRRSTLKHRFVYGTCPEQGVVRPLPGIVRIDAQTGRTSWYAANDTYFSEPSFVPKDRYSREGEGWLLTVGRERRARRTKLVILDAESIENGPVVEALLPGDIPPPFHGMFVRA